MRLSVFVLLLGLGIASAASAGETILPATPAAGNMNVFATQLAYGNDGAVYTVNVEPAAGTPTGVNLQTVVRRGRQNLTTGVWSWTSKVIENRTMDDPFHTQPSIALDRTGRIHIVYNMHNMPWQYAVSAKANDISSFEFKGEFVTDETISLVKFKSATPFPSLGSAAIPGTQITYPAFFKDRRGELFVTYRQAVRPKRPFAEREYACGIARFDASARTWKALGGAINVTAADAQEAGTVTAFCAQSGWWGYHPRLWFDTANVMHVSWAWRQGNAGGDCTNLSYAYSTDGGKTFRRSNGTAYTLPIRVNDGGSVLASPTTKVSCRTEIDSTVDGRPLISFQNYAAGFAMVDRQASGAWGQPYAAPYGGQVVMSGGSPELWSFASGPRILDGDLGQRWTLLHQETGYCTVKALAMPTKQAFLVHAQACDHSLVKVVLMPWSGSGS
ncbi:BNR-4 repeat-containing protein [Lacibacterium aquatile]|uniref:BNR-4 repeat-containing protein n=1 Tax=Lacibacterium aquatile TaxID=1168082 RepID=A0ABW5DWD7_9PROT